MDRDPAGPASAPVRTLAALALLLIGGAVGPADATAQGDPLAGFGEYVASAAEAWDAVGLAVAVVKDGELLFARGYGTRALGRDAPVTEHTLFAIGSTTKAMTATAVGMLVDEGRLAWDDPVRRHLPWFEVDDPWVSREITIRDLLTHRAGLGNADFLWYERDTDTEAVVRAMAMAEPAYSMRSSFIYQNVMYAAAGEVVEAVSGIPWTRFVETRILEPLGMERTVALLADAEAMGDVARPHHRVDGELVEIDNASVDPVAPAGSVWSSVTDMSLWLRFLLAEGVAADGTRLLEEATVEELFRPQALVPRSQFYPTARLTDPAWTTYGLGWFQHDYRGEKVDFHTGSIDGMVAIAGLIRDRELGVYVLANRDHVEVRHALMYRVFDLFLGGGGRDWSAELKALYDGLDAEAEEARAEAEAARVAGTEPSHRLEAFAGAYEHPFFGAAEVRLEEGRLRVDYGPGQPGTLEHWHYDTFRLVPDAAWRGRPLVTFVTGTDGGVTGLRVGGLVLERVRAQGGGG